MGHRKYTTYARRPMQSSSVMYSVGRLYEGEEMGR
jgi:hypothetical protein